MKRSHHRFLVSVAAAATLQLLPATAQAQVAETNSAPVDEQAAEATDGLNAEGEIVVTAQKIGQSLQSVPLAITAVTAADLQRLQLTSAEDLKVVTPNLSIERNLSNPSTPRLFIRGIGVANSAFSFDSPIGIYVDDVYFPRVTGSLIDFFDIERIEVLRGPQGTIYGRNASIGAIRVITKAPPLNGFDGSAEATYGTRNQLDFRGGFGAALVEDKVGARLSFVTKHNDGFQLNTANGERVQNDDMWAARGSLLFQLTDNASITLRGDYLHDASRPTVGSRFLNDPDGNLRTFISNLSYRDGTARSLVETWGASATGRVQLGGVELTSITAFRGIKQRAAFDTDGSLLGRFEVKRGDLDQRQFTQEIFATGRELAKLPVDWVAGIFYFHEPNEYDWSLQVVAPPATLQTFNQVQDSVAAYAQGIFRVTDTVRLTGGLRYTHEAKDFRAIGYKADGTTDFTFDRDNIKNNKLTWRLGADVDLTSDVLVYATASTGFRSAALNGNAQSLAEVEGGAFGVEDTLMYEAGLKSRFWDNRVTFNLAAFYGEYSNLQQAVTRSDGSVSTTSNNADIYGVEMELRLRPVTGLDLFAALGTLHDDIQNSARKLVGPKFNASLGGSYTLGVGAAGDLRLAGSYTHVGRQFGDVNNNPALVVEPHDNVDASLTYLPRGTDVQITVGGYNLTNEIYEVGGFSIANGFISAVKFPSLPRRFYVRVRYDF